jgi:hypothetical protein
MTWGEAKVQTEIGTGGKSAFRNDGNGDQEDESENDSESELARFTITQLLLSLC